jgi:hypothetical protein
MDGIATTLTSWNAAIVRVTLPPRATVTRLARGATLGRPGDSEQQQRVLDATLELLGRDAPIRPVALDERWE